MSRKQIWNQSIYFTVFPKTKGQKRCEYGDSPASSADLNCQKTSHLAEVTVERVALETEGHTLQADALLQTR